MTNLGQFAAERGDRLLDPVGALQRLDLAGDLEQMPLERGEIRSRRVAGRRRAPSGAVGATRRGAARRQWPRRGAVEFALARGDFRDREIERGRAERRRGAIDLGWRRARPCRPGAAYPGAGPVSPARDWRSATAARRGARWRRSIAGRRPARARRRWRRSLRGVGREICSIWRVIESSRW